MANSWPDAISYGVLTSNLIGRRFEQFDTNKDGQVDSLDTDQNGSEDAWDDNGDDIVDGMPRALPWPLERLFLPAFDGSQAQVGSNARKTQIVACSMGHE
jgi:hypothetical protein